MAYSYALVLTVRSPEKISNSVKNKAAKTHVGYVYKQTLISLVSQWCILHHWWRGCNWVTIIHIGVKFGVARFDTIRQFSGALNGEASDEWASRFLFICICYSLLNNFDAKPHRTNFMYYEEDRIYQV